MQPASKLERNRQITIITRRHTGNGWLRISDFQPPYADHVFADPILLMRNYRGEHQG